MIKYFKGSLPLLDTAWVNVDVIYVPVHLNDHWFSIVIDFKEWKMCIYDSLMTQSSCAKTLVHVKRMAVMIAHIL